MNERDIKVISELDLSLLNQTPKGKSLVKRIATNLEESVWLIKAWGVKFSLRELVDFLYHYDLDVFDIEYGSVTRIYVCRKDAYRISNSVVFSLKNEQVSR